MATLEGGGDDPRTDRPTWSRHHATDLVDGEWHLDLGDATQLTLGEVPEDARIVVTTAAGALAVEADETPPSARLRVVGGRSLTLNVGAAFSAVTVDEALSSLTFTTSHETELTYGDLRIRIVADAADPVRLQLTLGPRPVIRPCRGLAAISTAGDVRLDPEPEDVVDLEVDVGGQLTMDRRGHPGKTRLTGWIRKVELGAGLGPNSDLRCREATIRGAVTGSTIEAELALHIAGEVQQSTLLVSQPALDSTALAVGTRHALVVTDPDPAQPPTASGAGTRDVVESVVRVAGDAHLVIGRAIESTVQTEGWLSLVDATRCALLSGGRGVLATGLVEGVGVAESKVVGSVVSANLFRNLTIKAERCHARQYVERVEVEASHRVGLAGGVIESKVTTEGDLTAGDLTDSEVSVAGQATVGSVTGGTTTIGGGTVRAADHRVHWTQSGALTIGTRTEVRSSGATDHLLTLIEGSTVDVDEGGRTCIAAEPIGSSDRGRSKDPRAPRLTVVAGDRSTLVLPKRIEIDLHALESHLTVVARAASTVRVEGSPARLALTAEAPVVLEGAVHRVTCAGGAALVLAAGATINDLEVQGSPVLARRGARIVALSGSLRINQNEGQLRGKRGAAPKITGIAKPEREGSEALGTLTDVDISELPFEDLEPLASLRVFDPAAKPLIALARLAKKDQKADPESFQLRDRAQWFEELAARSTGHSLTGSARTAIDWSRLYLHNQRLPRWSPERAFRRVHRVLGYGYRPVPAFFAVLAITLVLALPALWGGCPQSVTDHGGNQLAVEQYCVLEVPGEQDPLIEQAGDFGRAWGSVAIAPAKLVRLADSSSPLPYYKAPLDTLTNAVLGAAFLFLVLALRNYLRLKIDV